MSDDSLSRSTRQRAHDRASSSIYPVQRPPGWEGGSSGTKQGYSILSHRLTGAQPASVLSPALISGILAWPPCRQSVGPSGQLLL